MHLFSGVLVVFTSPLLTKLDLFAESNHYLFLPLVICLLVSFTAVVNFTNFMDGLDGLVAGCASLAICAVDQDFHPSLSSHLLVH